MNSNAAVKGLRVRRCWLLIPVFAALFAPACPADPDDEGSRIVVASESAALPEATAESRPDPLTPPGLDATQSEQSISAADQPTTGPSDGTGAAPTEAQSDTERTTAESNAPESRPDANPLEPAASSPTSYPVPTAVIAPISTAGGEIAAGGYRVAIPARRSADEDVVWAPLTPPAIRRPRPLSLPLAIAELQPAYETTPEMMRITFPLERPVEPGTRLQLLAFSRSMDAFSVVDETRLSGDGSSVTFRTDLFTQYVVIAKPTVADTDCGIEPLAIHQRIPDLDERQVVGTVPEENRMPREVAFAVLSDLRHVAGAEHIVFKDEERRLGGDIRHDGEDYLVDPRLTQPLVELGRAVMEQWVDPVGGGPAFQLRVTDAYDASYEHSPTSNHYRGRAVDLTLSPVPAASPTARREYYGRLSSLAVCAGFEFVHFENRYHVHASSRPARLAYVERTPEGPCIYTSEIDGHDRTEVQVDPGTVHGLELRALEFSETGRELLIHARRKGDPTAYRVDLATSHTEPIMPQADIPGIVQSLVVDRSLEIAVDSRDRLVLCRPEGDGDEDDTNEEFALTADGVRGRLPAIWRGVTRR